MKIVARNDDSALVPEQRETVKRGKIRIMKSLQEFSLRIIYRNQ